jgi:hypothetical protein
MTRAAEAYGGVTIAVFGPLLLARFDPGWTLEDFGRAMDRILTLAPPRFAIISEMRKVKPAGALERKWMSNRLSHVRAEIDTRIVVSAVVADSILTRGAIRAMRLLSPARYPMLTFENVGTAIHECIARLTEAGISIADEDADAARAFGDDMERDRRSGWPSRG